MFTCGFLLNPLLWDGIKHSCSPSSTNPQYPYETNLKWFSMIDKDQFYQFKISTRKSSYVNARGVPTAAYQVLHLLSYTAGGGRYLGVRPAVDRQTPVKTVPYRRTTYAVGNKVLVSKNGKHTSRIPHEIYKLSLSDWLTIRIQLLSLVATESHIHGLK